MPSMLVKHKEVLRYSEHFSAYRNNHPDRSNFARHLLEENHNMNIDNITLLHHCQNYMKLNFLEALEIKKYLNDVQYTIVTEQLDL